MPFERFGLKIDSKVQNDRELLRLEENKKSTLAGKLSKS